MQIPQEAPGSADQQPRPGSADAFGYRPPVANKFSRWLDFNTEDRQGVEKNDKVHRVDGRRGIGKHGRRFQDP